MEAYTTAHIEVVTFEEDVITASVVKCEEFKVDPGVNSTETGGWTVYYSDGTTANYSGPDKPEVCP